MYLDLAFVALKQIEFWPQFGDTLPSFIRQVYQTKKKTVWLKISLISDQTKMKAYERKKRNSVFQQ
jgi:tellurite resistance-related uncharacterized protein